MTDEQTIRTSAVAAALEGTWAAIRRHHPEVPPAIVTLATNTGAKAGDKMITAGHWSSARWEVPGTGRRGEVVIAGEVLSRGPEVILEILLHEAAHGLAHVRGIKDTSRGGRYHNKRYKVLAEELGLELLERDPDDTHGFYNTKPTARTVNEYAAELWSLAEAHQAAQRVYRVLPGRTPTRGPKAGAAGASGAADNEGDDEGTFVDPAPPKATRIKLQCPCGRGMMMAPGVFALGEVFCGVCGAAFTVDGK